MIKGHHNINQYLEKYLDGNIHNEYKPYNENHTNEDLKSKYYWHDSLHHKSSRVKILLRYNKRLKKKGHSKPTKKYNNLLSRYEKSLYSFAFYVTPNYLKEI